MSLLKNALAKNYIGDIYEASLLLVPSDEFFAHRIRRYYLNNTIFGHKKLVKRA